MDWLSARSKASPEKTFLHIDQETLSFDEVNRLVSAACHLIQQRADIKHGDKVAILLPNGLSFILTTLALMRLRAVSVPLNTRLIPTELAWQVKNANCRLLICNADTRSQTKDIAVDALDLPPIQASDALHDSIESGALDLAEDFAIIHTSGTSGKPKAAVLTYGNFYHSASASASRLGVLPNDRWLCVLPLYHVGGLSVILRSLLYGTAVELMPFAIDKVNLALSERAISLVSLVPTMLQWLLDARQQEWNPQLRLILLGGEAPSTALIARCMAESIPIAASYGLTEAASQVATALPDSLRQKPGSIGRPLLFTEVRAVDEQGSDTPPNSPGEVLVKGPTVMRGYYSAPDATRKALRDGWLHTGDIGYLDADGDLFILQRRADLIVSGGENVYPAEVEAVLRQHPDVAEAVALGLPDAEWGQCVAAVIECRDGQSPSADAISQIARAHLAGYKIPRRIAFVEALPRTSSGKIQRREARKVFNDALPSSN